jgi:integrase
MLSKERLQDAYNNFIINYSESKALTPKTVKNKRDALDGLMPFLNGRTFDYVTANEYVLFKFNNGWEKSNSRANIAKNLRAFVNFLFEYDYIEKNFAKKIIKPKVIPLPEQLPDIDEAEQIIIAGTTGTKYDHSLHRKQKALMRFALKFALRTGLRGNELINIRGEDLFFDNAEPMNSKIFIIAAKGGVPQWQPMPLDLIKELQKHTTDERVFPVSIKTCNLVLKRGAKLVGLSPNINMHVHILRKVFGTTMSRCLTMAKVAKLMRHSDISITQKFYITYGLQELGQDLNMNHPLIRIAVPADEDIRAFINNLVYSHFSRSKNIVIKHIHDPVKRSFVLEFTY